MLVPHLHFCGDCAEAIALYEKAFDTEVESVNYVDDGKTIDHSVVKIHGTTVFLNDNFGNKNRTRDCAAHIIITFKTPEALLSCYELLKTDGEDDEFYTTHYSKLCGNFMDKFGVLWGFMADA